MSKRATIPSFSEPRPTVFTERTSNRADNASPHLKLVDAATHLRYERIMGLFSGGVFTPAAESMVEWLTAMDGEPLHESIVRISQLLPLLGTLDADAERIIHRAVEMDAAAWQSFIGNIRSRHDAIASMPQPAVVQPDESESEPGDSELVAALLSDDEPDFVDLDDLDAPDDDLAKLEAETTEAA